MTVEVPPYFNRKEVASMVHLSVRTLANNEKRLGLDAAKEVISPRLIRYKALMVLSVLESKGFNISLS